MPFQIYTIPRYSNVSVTDKWINIYELLYEVQYRLYLMEYSTSVCEIKLWYVTIL